ncbi:MAG TPA: substrate-binding domain-containing protein [Burkholderiales bacterium]|nr:substrate-binding domain-containing protein [Burkholderiales bacterium]
MATLRILSAGAAQAVTERIIEAFKRDTGAEVGASFAAVGAIKARVTRGEPVDVIILTQAMIDELVASGVIKQGTRINLGTVGTGVAVRAGTPAPDVSTEQALRAAVLGSGKIVCPDPAIATAGKIVMSCMEKLGIEADVRRRLQFFPNGFAAMAWLAASRDAGELGITQVTEIVPNKGVTYAGPLPEAFQMKTVYSAGLAQNAAEPALARDFIARYTGPAAEALLGDAGFELR